MLYSNTIETKIKLSMAEHTIKIEESEEKDEQVKSQAMVEGDLDGLNTTAYVSKIVAEVSDHIHSHLDLSRLVQDHSQ